MVRLEIRDAREPVCMVRAPVQGHDEPEMKVRAPEEKAIRALLTATTAKVSASSLVRLDA